MDLDCPVCTHHSKPGVGSIPYPSQKSKATIAFCSQCHVGVRQPLYSPEELNSLYEGGGFWGEVQLKTSLRSFAMPLTLASHRVSFLAKQCGIQGGKVLDIGSGPGLFGLAACKNWGSNLQGYDVVEPDPRMVKQLKTFWELKGGEVPLSVFDHVEKVSGKYDLVVLSHVVEHLVNPIEFLSNLKKLLTPNGAIFVEVPYQDFRYKDDVEGHVLFFRPEQLRTLFEKAGLTPNFVGVFGKTPETTPINKQNHRGFGFFFERVWGKFGRYIPLAVSSWFFSGRYGIKRQQDDGTWIRILGRVGNG